MTDLAKLARDLKPYILPWIVGGGSSAPAAGGGMVAHELSGAYHTGQLAQSQATWAATAASLNAHMANVNAHHARLHSLDSTSDHSGTLSWVKVSKTGASLADLPTRLYGDLQSRTHSVTGGDHSIAAAQYSVVGTTALNTLGVLSSSADASADGGGVVNLLRALAGAVGVNQVTSQSTITLSPTSDQVLPTGSILKDLGDYNRKWRSLYAAELYVETLVAQDVLATIGGRIMVAPTTKLIADLASGGTTIDVEHNNITGAFLYLASAPGGVAQVEVMKVTAGPTAITGGYRYTVTRNLDGSGANAWVAGDAVANIGSAAGQGWLELTSTNTVRNHLGPTMTIYSRTGTAAWTDVKPVVSVGNLRSFVDYGADEFGFALGNDLALTPAAGFSGMTGDRTSGLRLFNTDVTWYVGGAKTIEITGAGGFELVTSTSWAPERAFSFVRPSDSATVGEIWAAHPVSGNGGTLHLDGGYGSDSTSLELFNTATDAGFEILAGTIPLISGSYYGTPRIETGGPVIIGTPSYSSGTLYDLSKDFDPDTGITFAGSNTIKVYTGGAERLGVSSTGVSVANALGVTGAATFGSTLTVAPASGTANAKLSPASTGDARLDIGIGRSGDGLSYIDFYADSSGSYTSRLMRGSGANGTLSLVQLGTGMLYLYTHNAAPIVFYTNTSARMTIAATGEVGIGKTPTSGVGLDVNGTLVTGGDAAIGGKVIANVLQAQSDVAGSSGRTTITNATATAAGGGIGGLLMNGATNRNNNGWMKIYIGTTAAYIPYWTVI